MNCNANELRINFVWSVPPVLPAKYMLSYRSNNSVDHNYSYDTRGHVQSLYILRPLLFPCSCDINTVIENCRFIFI